MFFETFYSSLLSSDVTSSGNSFVVFLNEKIGLYAMRGILVARAH